MTNQQTADRAKFILVPTTTPPPTPGCTLLSQITVMLDSISSTLASFFQQDNARPHTVHFAMNCLKTCQTLPWLARSLSSRACLGYDGKATACNKECY
ncbi:hypothetical protein TNCV_2892371 [Trichonephila clavipes]|nr:hypothetical protein TNCV_2892371 [Trichonephila clavipes]